MKNLHSIFLAIATVLFTAFGLTAQTLTADGNTHTINAFSSPLDTGSVQDYTIPSNTLYNFISFTLRGGDGGYAKAGADCKSNGGAGATTEAVFWIGTGTNELQPGGTIRFIVGKHGENGDVGGSANTAGGGGGGTAVLYRPNSTENWTILAVAGAGGGAHQGNVLGGCVDSQLGQGGRSSESGGDGEGANSGSGGTNGNAGSNGSNTLNHGAGGGGANSGSGGEKGLPDGGDGGNSSHTSVGDGGYGFGGGGGAGNNGGGGGGGYSGGGGGATYNNGGGGGSYVHPNYAYSSTKTEGSLGGGNSQNGHVDYTIFDSEIVWTGAVNTAWNNTGNWSPARLPQSIDHVIIPNVTNDPVLTTTATIKSLDIQANAALTVAEQGTLNVSKSILNGIKVSGTLTNKGLIQINNTGSSALAIFGSNDAAAYLYGDLNIGNSSNIGGDGIYVEGSLLVDKDPANTAATDLNPTINIINVSGNGISCINCDITIDETSYGSFTPTANINIGTSGTIGNIGIANTGDLNLLNGAITIGNTTSHGLVNTSFAGNPGEIYLAAGGTLSIGSATKSIAGNGLKMSTGTFFNSGTLNVRNTVADGIENSSSFTNNASGIIHVDQTTSNGIKCLGGTFTNKGQTVLGQFSNIGDGGISLNSTGKFTNNASGTVSLWQTNDEGISTTNTSVFENFGVMNLGGLGGSGIGGIGISCLSSFINKSGGVIFVDQTSSVGIFTLNAGVFINEGNITFGANATIGYDGIQNKATFNNLASGSIFIEQVGQYGIYNLGGSFSNEGSIKIEDNGIQNENGSGNAVFLNGPCGALIHILDGNIEDVSNSFTNSGTIIKESTGNSNIETNNGTIFYNAGTFTADNGNVPISHTGSFTNRKLWTGCTSSAWAIANNWYPSGVPTTTNQVIIYPSSNDPVIASGTQGFGVVVILESGTTLTNNGKLTVADGNLWIKAGATVQGDGEYIIAKSFVIDNGGTFTPGTSLVKMINGGVGHSIRNIPISFYDLVIDKDPSSQLTIETDVTITNSFALNSGILNIPSGGSLALQFLLPFAPTAGTSVINNGTLTLTGIGFSIGTNVSVQGNGQYILSGATSSIALVGGTFNPGTSTVNLTGTGTQSIALDPMDFYNLVIDKTSGVAQLGGNITVANELDMVSGNLNLRGKEAELIGNGAIIGEGTSSYIYGTPPPFFTFGGVVKKTVNLNAPTAANPGNIGAIITSTVNLGSTTIQRGHDVQQVNGSASILRYYDISPANNSGLDATVRFSYFDHELNGNGEGGLKPFRFNGTDWDYYMVSASDAAANWVETENINAFSKWSLLSCNLSTFYIDSDGDGFGDPAVSTFDCFTPSGYVTDNTDCNDGDATIFPGAVEICDGIDNDCNGTIDDGQTIWTGTNGTGWDDSDNWTNGVPEACDEVIIPDVVNDPVIDGTTAAEAKSVTVEAGAMLSIASGGSLTLDVVSNNLGIQNFGTIDNDGTITVDGPTGDGIYNEGTLDNAGTINIGHSQSPTQQGIQVVGILTNTGTLDVRRGNDQGIQIDAGGQLNNESSGNIFIGQNGGSLGLHGLKVNGTFANDGGTVKIDNASENGIRSIGGAISNLNGGAINIGTVDGNIGRIGLFLESGADFTNDGSTLNIDNTGTPLAFFGEGIGCYTASLFENKNGSAVNLGLSGGSIGNTGIYVFSNSTFNNDDADINIDNTGNDGIFTAATFNNKNGGNINIGWVDGNIVGDGLQVGFGGTFHNQDCSNTKVADNLNNLSNFTNDGYLLLNTAENHTLGNFVNNGIVEDVQGTFTGGTNNEIIVEETTTSNCSSVSPAFGLGTTVDFNILGVFTDANAAQSAGTYDVATNTFTPTLPFTLSSYDFYVKIEDPMGSCTLIVEWAITSSSTAVTCYLDSDGDFYGDPANSQVFCDVCGTGYILDNTDCNDSDGDEFPYQIWYIDADGDNYGGSSVIACERPTNGFLISELQGNGTDDCDDNDGNEFPGQTWYIDADGDNYGGSSTVACERPTYGKTNNEVNGTGTDDCEDNDSAIHPAATEVCDGIDNDCDGMTDTADPNFVDNTAPNVNCQNINRDLDANGSVAITASEVFASGSDDCGTVNLVSVLPNTFDCNNLGGNSVTLTVNDGNGNENTCTATVTVGDNILPTPTCLDPTIELNANGSYTLSETDVFGGGTDNCGTVNFVSVFPSTVDCSNVWSAVTVTVTANDGNGNENTCESTVTVEDNTLPTPTCLNPTVELDASGYYAFQAGDVFAGGSDNCSVLNFLSVSPSTVDCSDVGSPVSATVTVFDASGNQATCTATVTVEDNELPQPICLDPIIQLDGTGNYSLLENDIFGGGSDNCGSVNFVSMSTTSVDCSNVGTPVSVTVTAQDANGNQNTCLATVTVEDNILPTANCQDLTIPLDNTGSAGISAAEIDNGSSDACGIGSRGLDIYGFNCADVGANTVILTVTDINGNENTCTATVTIEDNTAPTAGCIVTTLQVALGADGEYIVDPNDLDNGSSDACGILSLSASPSLLDCTNEGQNNITLSVTDVNGNTSTCTATVEVAPFFSIDNIIVTGESCAGAGDGSIVVEASTGGGQVGYSIDGGASFQFGNTFPSLTPGTYNIVVKLFGIPVACEKTATADVGAGGQAQTWYRDMDGDGYSDGMTMDACSQPAGYIAAPLAGTDCNDMDGTVYPGATELCDGIDNDCDGIVPADELDSDGDGFSSCNGDCDDSNAAVYPGATEVCNGIDDDCDGEVDEGVSGGQTFVGNATFASQADVDAWMACYSVIDGNLTIMGSDIVDLGSLLALEEVTGTVSIYYNGSLASLDGLDNLATIGGGLTMFYNFLLADCCAIDPLLSSGGVSGTVTIFFNATGCNSVSEINSNCSGNSLVNDPNSIYDHFQPESSNQFDSKQHEFTLFPNPSSQQTTLQFNDEPNSVRIRIIDISGRFVFESIEINPRNIQIDISEWKPGTYIVQAISDNGDIAFKKLIVDNNK